MRNLESNIDEMDAFFEEMYKAGEADKLDVSDIVFTRRPKNKDKNNNGKNFFDRSVKKKSKEFKENEARNTFEKAGREVSRRPIKTSSDNQKDFRTSTEPKKKSYHFPIIAFNLLPDYKRSVFNDGVAPIPVTSIIKDSSVINNDELNFTKEEWEKEIRPLFIKYLVSTRYPSALYKAEEFVEDFDGFRGYISTKINGKSIWFLPCGLTENFVGLYIIDMDSVDEFDKAIVSWYDNEWSPSLILADWIPVVLSASELTNRIIYEDSILTDMYESRTQTCKEVKDFIYEYFSNEKGFTYDELVDCMIYAEAAREDLNEKVDELIPGYIILNDGFLTNDEMDSSYNKGDEYDDNEPEEETEESDDVEEDLVEGEGSEEPEADPEDENESADEETTDNIDQMIEEAYEKASEDEPENEETEEEKEAIDVTLPEKKEVISDAKSSIVIEQKGDDPDSIVIKPFKKG